MKLASGAQARTTTGEKGLVLRDGPGMMYKRRATIKDGVLMRLLTDPVNGWAQVELHGHTVDDKTIYSEPDAGSSIEATRGQTAKWRTVTLTGYVATGYLTVEDGLP